MDFTAITTFISKSVRYEKKSLSEACPTITMPFEICSRSGGGKGTRLVFCFNDKEFECEDAHVSNVIRFNAAVRDALKLLNGTHGYKVEYTKGYYSYEGRDVFGKTILRQETVSALVLVVKPCKDFNALAKLVLKYANLNVKPTDLYSVRILGKRGMSYRETGERHYYAHNPKKCARIIAWIKDNKHPTDKLYARVETYDDCPDRAYSQEYETESYGSRHSFLRLRIIRKNGTERRATDTIFV